MNWHVSITFCVRLLLLHLVQFIFLLYTVLWMFYDVIIVPFSYSAVYSLETCTILYLIVLFDHTFFYSVYMY